MELKIIRDAVDGKKKYCRIPIRSKTADKLQADGIADLSAETILGMPHDKAVRTIDELVNDWAYWVRRANELFVMWAGCQEADDGK